ncbi:MAG: hypothetical protein VYE22_07690 [Myxococcota bacterium]|nr:hypothetical protein [Myxococcota bacterium]
MDIFDRSRDLMDQVQETLREASPLIEGTTGLVKDTQTLTTKAAGTLSNCNSVLAELSALLSARTRLAKLECEKLELEIAALKSSAPQSS